MRWGCVCTMYLTLYFIQFNHFRRNFGSAVENIVLIDATNIVSVMMMKCDPNVLSSDPDACLPASNFYSPGSECTTRTL